jgi:hypothetical protein
MKCSTILSYVKKKVVAGGFFMKLRTLIELRNDKTNIMGLRPAWIQNSLRILQTLLQAEKLIANSMDPDQTARMCRLVWIHTGRKPIMLVLSWRGSNNLS